MVNNQLNNSSMKRLIYAVIIVAIIATIIMIKPNFKTYSECRYFRSEEFTDIKSFILRSTQEFSYHLYRTPLNLSEVISYIQTSDPLRAEELKNIQNEYSLELIKDSTRQQLDLILVVSSKIKEKVPLEEFNLFNCVFSRKNIILGSEPLKDYICNREDAHILLVAEDNSELFNDSIAKDFKGCISKFLKRHVKIDKGYSLDKNKPKRYLLRGWKSNNLIKCKVLCNYTTEEVQSVRFFEDSISLILTPKITKYNLKEVYLPFALFDIHKEGKLMYSASFNIIGFNENY